LYLLLISAFLISEALSKILDAENIVTGAHARMAEAGCSLSLSDDFFQNNNVQSGLYGSNCVKLMD
jgi:hypothetical protein